MTFANRSVFGKGIKDGSPTPDPYGFSARRVSSRAGTSPYPLTMEMSESAMRAGELERRRLRGRRGRGSTVLTPGALAPVTSAQPALRTTTG